jgi:hypothetical protein
LNLEPKIWAKQVLDEYGDTVPDYIAGLVSNERRYGRRPDVFRKISGTYDAFEKDIAVVQVMIALLF